MTAAILAFIKAHKLIILIALLFLIILFRLLSKNRAKKKELTEMSRRRDRDAMLSEALKNPLIKDQPREKETPLKVQWNAEPGSGRRAGNSQCMIELLELSSYVQKKYVFRVDEPVSIGSADDNGLVIFKEDVAAHHCEIFSAGGSPCIRSNPGAVTVVKRGRNRAVVGTDGIYLNNADEILIGSTSVRIRIYNT